MSEPNVAYAECLGYRHVRVLSIAHRAVALYVPRVEGCRWLVDGAHAIISFALL